MKILRFLLFPFSIIYGLITYIRNICFDRGFLKSTTFNTPVIAVGNLSVGGTGKTPQIEYLIKLLSPKYKVAVLSRGYKRTTKGYLRVKENHTALDVGDEPLQFFKKFGNDIIVCVDADRVNGIKLIEKQHKPDVILLDDAYQHRKVNARCYILLTSYNDLYVDDFMLPTGNLREYSKGSSRAKIIIVTKCPNDLSKDEQEIIKHKLRLQKKQQLFFSAIKYKNVIKKGKTLNINTLKNKKILLVTGIAKPKPLVNYLNSKHIVFQHLTFPDHHNFNEKDITKIKSYDIDIILTTEKDYTRLHNKLSNLQFISISTYIIENQNKFDKKIISEVLL